VPVSVVADRGYSSHAFRQHVKDLGAQPAIPPKVNEALVAYPELICNNRNHIEESEAIFRTDTAEKLTFLEQIINESNYYWHLMSFLPLIGYSLTILRIF